MQVNTTWTATMDLDLDNASPEELHGIKAAVEDGNTSSKSDVEGTDLANELHNLPYLLPKEFTAFATPQSIVKLGVSKLFPNIALWVL